MNEKRVGLQIGIMFFCHFQIRAYTEIELVQNNMIWPRTTVALSVVTPRSNHRKHVVNLSSSSSWCSKTGRVCFLWGLLSVIMKFLSLIHSVLMINSRSVMNIINVTHFNLWVLSESTIEKGVGVQTRSKPWSYNVLGLCGWMKASQILV